MNSYTRDSDFWAFEIITNVPDGLDMSAFGYLNLWIMVGRKEEIDS